MVCKCVEAESNAIFIVGREYKVIENIGIWSPILCKFENWNNPGVLSKGMLFTYADSKFVILE